MKRFPAIVFSLLLACAGPAAAYGPDGHKIIGAIADQKLAGTAAGTKVTELLDGYTLSEASIMADTIKQWDKPGIDDPKVRKYFSSHPKIAEQLRAFWQANPPATDRKAEIPSHHWFHYTDVPLVGAEHYSEGKVGRSQWDIVHLMRYCIEVLQGTKPAENERKISPSIALILLAHFVGDIHQPLHVGAQYFDAQGHPVNPDKVSESFPDEGGNSLRIILAKAAARKRTPKLHGFWDNDAVMANLPQLPETMPKEERQAKMDEAATALTNQMSKAEPAHWRLPASFKPVDYPEAWANEVLPLAREVYGRLRYQNVTPKLDEETMVADGEVVEEPSRDGVSYAQWSAGVVRGELQKAGWRLADLIQKCFAPNEAAALSPTTTPALRTPSSP